MISNLINLCLILMTIFLTSCNSGSTTASSKPQTNPEGDIYFGDISGSVYKNSDILSGVSPQVFGVSSNVMTSDSLGNIYLGTGDGFVYKYANGLWNILGNNYANGVGGPISDIAIVNDNVYVIINFNTIESFSLNGNGKWQQVGSEIPNAYSLTASESNLYVGISNYGSQDYIESYPLDGSSDWQILNQTPLSPINAALTSLVTDGQYLYTNYDESVVSISVNGGDWNTIGGGNVDGNNSVTSVYLNSNIIYASTSSNKVESTNVNVTGIWNELGGSPLTNGISNIAVANGVLYVGLFEGVVESTILNQNTSWNILGSESVGQAITFVLPINNVIYVTRGLQQDGQSISVESINSAGTNSWSFVGNNISASGSSVFSVVESLGIMYIGMFSGYVESYNNGQWSILGGSSVNYNNPVNSLAIANNILYAATLYAIESININGGNWNQVGQDLYNFGNITSITTDNNVVYASTSEGYVESISINGSTWLPLGVESIDSGVSINSIAAKNGLVVAGLNDGSIWVNYNNSNWIKQGIGKLDSSVNNVAIFDNTIYAATNNGYVYQSINSSPWTKVGLLPIDGTSIEILQVDQYGNIYAGTVGGYVYECTLGYISCQWVRKYGSGYPILFKYQSSLE